MKLEDLTPKKLTAGLYKYKAVVSTGPILVQTRAGNDDSFSTETDGSIASSENGTIRIGKGEELQVSLQAGDSFYISISDRD